MCQKCAMGIQKGLLQRCLESSGKPYSRGGGKIWTNSLSMSRKFASITERENVLSWHSIPRLKSQGRSWHIKGINTPSLNISENVLGHFALTHSLKPGIVVDVGARPCWWEWDMIHSQSSLWDQPETEKRQLASP